MKLSTFTYLTSVVGLVGACVFLGVQNRGLRRELEDIAMRRPRIALDQKDAPVFERPVKHRSPQRVPAKNPVQSPASDIVDRPMDSANGGIAAQKPDEAYELPVVAFDELIAMMTEERRKSLESLKAMPQEEKDRRRDAFLQKKREDAVTQKSDFIRNANLNQDQAAAFTETVSTLDRALQESAAEWAASIRASGSFSAEDRMRFMRDMSEIIDSGYEMMDSSLPKTWREDNGDFNLMQLLGNEAFAPVVDALAETGIDDGIRVIEMLMGGPGSGEGGTTPLGESGMPELTDGAPGQMGRPDGGLEDRQ